MNPSHLNPKNQLQEYQQKRGAPLPYYERLTHGTFLGQKWISRVYLEGTLVGQGEGASKGQADLEAAAAALKSLAPAQPES